LTGGTVLTVPLGVINVSTDPEIPTLVSSSPEMLTVVPIAIK
jgi:hypothetical protein